MAHKDRRKNRKPRRKQLEFRNPGEAVWRRAFTVNLSTEGAFVATNMPSPPGREIAIRLPPGADPEVPARVVHSRRGLLGMSGAMQSGMGIRFLEPLASIEQNSPSTEPVEAASDTVATATAAPALEEEVVSGEIETEAADEIRESTTGALKAEPLETRSADALAFEMRPASGVATLTPEEELERLESRNRDLAALIETSSQEVDRLNEIVARLQEGHGRLDAAAQAEARRADAAQHDLDSTTTQLRRRLQSAEEYRASLERELDRVRSEFAEIEAGSVTDSSTGGPETALEPEPSPRPVGAPPSPTAHWARAISLVAAGVVIGLLLGLLLRPSARPRATTDVAASEPTAPQSTAPAPADSAAATAADAPSLILTPPIDGVGEPSVELPEAAPSTADSATEAIGSASSEPAPPELASLELAPSEPAPHQSAVAPAPSAVVTAWAAAWAAQNVAEYLSHYATSFTPPNASRPVWESQRRERIARPEWIQIQLGPIESTSVDANRMTTTFEQTYETPTYRDRVTKVLELVREDGTWKIETERSE